MYIANQNLFDRTSVFGGREFAVLARQSCRAAAEWNTSGEQHQRRPR